jgi:tape measure domain-containing protein
MSLPNQAALKSLGEVGNKAKQTGDKIKKEIGGAMPRVRMPSSKSGGASMGGGGFAGVSSSGGFGGASIFGGIGLATAGIAAATTALVAFGKSAFDASMKFQGLQNQLKFATGSAAIARSDFAYLKKASNDLGLDLLSTASAYAKLAGATRGTNMEGQKTRDIFMGISMAGTVMHMSTEQMERSLYAVQQMASKGTVSSEELKQQLGDSLPGAMQRAARAMKMPVEQFNKLLAEGKILSNDFLPKFANQLQTEFAGGVENASKSSQASLNRFSTSWDLLKLRVGDAGLLDGASSGLDIGAKLLTKLGDTIPYITALFEPLTASFARAGEIIRANFGNLKGYFGDIAKGIGFVFKGLGAVIGQWVEGLATQLAGVAKIWAGIKSHDFAMVLSGGKQAIKGGLLMVSSPAAALKAFTPTVAKGGAADTTAQDEAARIAKEKATAATAAAMKDRNALTGTISGQRPQIVNINIQDLIRTMTVQANTLSEGMPEVKRIVIETLLDAVNNTQRYAPAN